MSASAERDLQFYPLLRQDEGTSFRHQPSSILHAPRVSHCGVRRCGTPARLLAKYARRGISPTWSTKRRIPRRDNRLRNHVISYAGRAAARRRPEATVCLLYNSDRLTVAEGRFDRLSVSRRWVISANVGALDASTIDTRAAADVLRYSTLQSPTATDADARKGCRKSITHFGSPASATREGIYAQRTPDTSIDHELRAHFVNRLIV